MMSKVSQHRKKAIVNTVCDYVIKFKPNCEPNLSLTNINVDCVKHANYSVIEFPKLDRSLGRTNRIYLAYRSSFY